MKGVEKVIPEEWIQQDTDESGTKGITNRARVKAFMEIPLIM